eukprot:CAMPEP_0114602314 /NCGR_PEP_ID=MMETSP0125-20121206/24904_1 /TAXON_ID=485358 ORGANISM="Aristerostoma sp., Strain ATCC 50986" /NCGR_SAMPLE_ID=MMETSP0125 /ASSEMBLY_ACC=CAM_ASM_000245 /LENGTH=111 /DNA_ID=CAMNT_0001812361 /DNA_START=334 /DNA_END=669 /DNA_ORIENTATION=-
MTKIGFALGLILSFGLSLLLPENPDKPTTLVRIMFLLPIVFSVIQIIYFVFVFKWDSPKYYFLNHKQEEAVMMIEKLYKPEFKDFMIEDYQNDVHHEEKLTFRELVAGYKR